VFPWSGPSTDNRFSKPFQVSHLFVASRYRHRDDGVDSFPGLYKWSKSALRCSLLQVGRSTREVIPRANECRLKSVSSIAMEPSIDGG